MRNTTALISFCAGLAIGGTAVYLLDPQQGPQRRVQARTHLTATTGPAVAAVLQTVQRNAPRASGLTQQVQQRTQRTSTDKDGLDDATLVDRVESMIFRDPAVPRGRMNINAEQGRVVLRGEVDQPEQISAVEAAVRAVPGVRDVENLLHLPDTPAPHS